jgi:hypothetical protein
LCHIPGLRLISLQKYNGVEQLADLPPGMTVETLGAEFDSGSDAFVDSAAVMMNLDLVISSDTAAAHLAGALGCPVWIVLQRVPDWRWTMDREDTPWYPTARLFRQTDGGDWDETRARRCRKNPAWRGLVQKNTGKSYLAAPFTPSGREGSRSKGSPESR